MGFGNSFVQGLSDGQKAAFNVMDQIRANKEFGLKENADKRAQAEADAVQAARTRTDQAYQDYEATTSGYGGNAGLIAQQDAAGGPVPPPEGGYAPPKQLTKLDQIGARKKLAMGLRSGPEAMAALDKEEYQAKFDSGLAERQLQFKAMKPEERAAFMEKYTEDAGMPINMIPTSGKTKDGKPQYMTWVEGKSRVRLSEEEAGVLFAAGGMMDSHPELARTMLLQGPEKIRALAKDYFTSMGAMMGTNNTATHYALGDENDSRRTGIAAAGLKLQKDKAAAEDWSIIGASDDDKGLLRFNRRTGETMVQKLPEGSSAAGIYQKIRGGSGTAEGKDSPVPEAGSLIRKADGRIVRIGPQGEEFDPKAPDPSKRGEVMSKLPAGASERVEWADDGRHIAFGNMLYDSTNAADMKELKETMNTGAANDVAAAEMRARGTAYNNPLTGMPGQNAPGNGAYYPRRAPAAGRDPSGKASRPNSMIYDERPLLGLPQR